MKTLLIVLLGLVDSVGSGYVVAEMTDNYGEVRIMEIPESIFPCEIEEGDMFYVVKIDSVTEIRCGEPPD